MLAGVGRVLGDIQGLREHRQYKPGWIVSLGTPLLALRLPRQELDSVMTRHVSAQGTDLISQMLPPVSHQFLRKFVKYFVPRRYEKGA